MRRARKRTPKLAGEQGAEGDGKLLSCQYQEELWASTMIPASP